MQLNLVTGLIHAHSTLKYKLLIVPQYITEVSETKILTTQHAVWQRQTGTARKAILTSYVTH